jgi:hypothetical protein
MRLEIVEVGAADVGRHHHPVPLSRERALVGMRRRAEPEGEKTYQREEGWIGVS